MTIKKLMMGAGAVASGPQVIAPSSNDWDYTFAQDEWPAAGNALGDNTSGGFVQGLANAESGVTSLQTFEGDFEITFTATTVASGTFGVLDITDDSLRRATNGLGMFAPAGTEVYWYTGANQGGGTGAYAYLYGASAEANAQIADGSVVKITRESGVVKFFDDDVLKRQFTTPNSNPMRFFISSPLLVPNIDNILFTDTEKVQRDGFFNEGTIAISEWGDLFGANYARRITATRTGTVGTVVLNITLITTSFDAVCQIYSDDGTSPASIIGSASDTVNIGATGDKTFTFASLPEVVKGTTYWVVFSDTTLAGTGRVTPGGLTQSGLPENQRGCGRHATITSITDNEVAPTLKMEMRINATGEPTPDHEVIFQVQSNDTNGSTSFTDESQTGSAVSAVDGAHHDNVQAKFGTTSIYCDGTDDEITIADNIDYSMPSDQPFTWEWWMYVNGTPANNTHCAGQGTDTRSSMAWWSRFNGDGTLTVATCNGSTQRNVTCTTNLSNAWHHIAYIHLNGKSYLCIDGSSEGTPSSHTDVVQNVAYPFTFGGGNNSASHVNAWFEGMRLSRTARYDPINGFTPPVARFPSS